VGVGVDARPEHVRVAGEVEEVVDEGAAVVGDDGRVREQVALEAADPVVALGAAD